MDWELISSSCPVTEKIPGFRYKNISALGVAVLVNASEDVATFLDIGCDPNFNGTYLTYIDTECANPIFKKLGISCAREVKIEGYTPLILAVLYGTTETFKKLVQAPHIDIDAYPSDLYAPLWLAADSGNFEMVQILAEAGANLESKGGEYLTTPLGTSIHGGNLNLLRYLISKGANVNSRSTSGSTPASYAANQGNVEILSMLQEAGADLDDLAGPSNTTLLTIAAAANRLNIVDFLISQRVDLNRVDLDGLNAVYFAARDGYLDILQSLAKAGADLDMIYGKQQYSAVSVALVEGNMDAALYLIKNGANIDIQSAKGFTPSDIAAYYGHLSVLKSSR